MFTGLVEEVGRVCWIRASERGTELEIAVPRTALPVQIGDSIAINGCCLTVSAQRPEQITFDLLDETLKRTNLGQLRRDSLVNLERALRADGTIGGHFVQGHIDGTARILSFEQAGKDHRLEVELLPDFSRYIVSKGSVAINGISLTVAEVSPGSFTTWIIPHTRRATNLQSAQRGEQVNLEFDILAKYVERMLPPGGASRSLP